MDLNTLNLKEAAETGAELHLEHPVSGEKLDIKIMLAGKDSAAFRNKEKEIQRERFSKMARGKKADLMLSDDTACDLLAICTLGWEGIEVDGEALEFNKKNAKELYLEHTWIRDQVDEFIGERANFFTMN